MNLDKGGRKKQMSKTVLDDHLEAFLSGNINRILLNYTEESTVIVPDQIIKGLDNIRKLFEQLLDLIPPASDLQLIHKVVDDNVCYIIWSATSEKISIPFASDTFVIENGKIKTQTMAFIIAGEDKPLYTIQPA